jgi:hypothetical protein
VPPSGWDDFFRATKPGIGTRTAADLLCDEAPDQLAGAFLTPEGPTILYGRGGMGKGVLACWFARQLVEQGHVVMLLDYEGHEREWGSRLRGMGVDEDRLRQIHYRAPYSPDWEAGSGALSVVAPDVREDCERLGVTYLVVDSYSVATSNGDTMGGEQAAREYFGALARIGRPSLTIAHVAGHNERFADRPFGSVFVHNLARETWAVGKVGDEPDEADLPAEEVYGPHVVALELRNKKSNGRPTAGPQFVTFSFYLGGSIEISTDPPVAKVADEIASVLVDGALTVQGIRAAIKEDTGNDRSENTIKSSLRRDRLRFSQATDSRPRKWSLA